MATDLAWTGRLVEWKNLKESVNPEKLCELRLWVSVGSESP